MAIVNDGNLSKAYPPKFNEDFLYPQEYNLDQLDMPDSLDFINQTTETQETAGGFSNMAQGQYFTVTMGYDGPPLGLTSNLSYGKHYFILKYNELPGTTTSPLPRLRAGSKILFEFKDASDESGQRRVIFSDLTEFKGAGSYFIAYVWLKEDPMRTYQSLVSGTGTLTIVGEVETINPEWRNKPNIRTTIDFGIDLSATNNNTSPLLFQHTSASLQEGIFISESQESYLNIPNQSFAHISASRLLTYGGKIGQIRVSLVTSSSFEEGRLNNGNSLEDAIYTDLAIHNVGSPGGEFKYENNIHPIYSKGISPSSEIWKISIPPDLVARGPIDGQGGTVYEKIKFKLTYTNSEASLAQNYYSEDSTNLFVVYPSGSDASDPNQWIAFTGSANVVTGEDNLITGEYNVGNTVEDSVVMGPGSDEDGNPTISFQVMEGGVRGQVITTIGKQGIIDDIDNNIVLSSNRTNISGYGNRALASNSATIFSAISSSITSSERGTVVAGSNNNMISSPDSMIIGSSGSNITSGSYNAIVGGQRNDLVTGHYGSSVDVGRGHMIVGGADNNITGSLTWRNQILGGEQNSIIATGDPDSVSTTNTILSGMQNTIYCMQYSSVVGGRGHTMGAFPWTNNAGLDNALIGGYQNHISNSVRRSVVLGGQNISASADDTVYCQNLDVSGNMTVNQLTASIVTSSIVLSDGSNIFGDEATDTHLFIGGITASNGISSSGFHTLSGSTYSTARWDGKWVFGNVATEYNNSLLFKQSNMGIQDVNDLAMLTSPMNADYVLVGNNSIASRMYGHGGAQLIVTGSNITSNVDVDVTGTVSASNFHLTSSGEVVVHMGSSGTNLSKWEFTRDGTRKFVIYNDGRTNAIVPQDSLVFKHGVESDGDDHINMSFQQDDQTVYCHGDISASGDVYGESFIGGDTNQPNFQINFSATSMSFGSGSTAATITSDGPAMAIHAGTKHITMGGNIDTGNRLNVKGSISSSNNIYLKNQYSIWWDEDGTNELSLRAIDSTWRFQSGSGLGITRLMEISQSGGSTFLGVGTAADPIPKELTVRGDISGSQLFLHSDDNPLITLERNNDQNAGIQFANSQGYMIAGIDNDIQNDGANVFGIGYGGDLIDNDGSNHATFVVTGSQVVINNATSASGDAALSVGGNINATNDITASGNINVGQYIRHDGDPNTHINFTGDDINITVGGMNMVDFTEAGNDEITFNEGAADLDVRIEGEDDANLLFTDASTPGRVGIGTNVPTKKLTVAGDISGSGNLYAKTFKSEKTKGFFNGAVDNTWYYFPVGSSPYSSVQAPGNTAPLSGFQSTAMCNLSIKRLKLTFFWAVTNMGTLSIKLQKYDGSGDPDGASNWADVGTTWEVTDADITHGDRAYHAPSDWDISAGENWCLAFNSNTDNSATNIIWFNGAVTIEEDWNNQVSS